MWSGKCGGAGSKQYPLSSAGYDRLTTVLLQQLARDFPYRRSSLQSALVQRPCTHIGGINNLSQLKEDKGC